MDQKEEDDAEIPRPEDRQRASSPPLPPPRSPPPGSLEEHRKYGGVNEKGNGGNGMLPSVAPERWTVDPRLANDPRNYKFLPR